MSEPSRVFRRNSARDTRQLALGFHSWGGRRAGAGRKPKGPRPGVAHVARPVHQSRHPVHVTLRAVAKLKSLRAQTVFKAMRGAFKRASRAWFRILHFSVQSNHVHLIVEARDKDALSRGMGGLSIRLARAANRVLGRRGRVWGDRYHGRAMRSPREVRSAIVYVLTNWRKHMPSAGGLDPCSSARWFDGWSVRTMSQEARGDCDESPVDWEESPVAKPRTWLAARGWRRRGLIGTSERPRDTR